MDLHTTESEIELNNELDKVLIDEDESNTGTAFPKGSKIQSSSLRFCRSSGNTFHIEEDAAISDKRLPTFKSLNEEIIKLRHENFILKTRIYLHEQKHGKIPQQSSGQQIYPEMMPTQEIFFTTPERQPILTACQKENCQYIGKVDLLEQENQILQEKLDIANEDLKVKGDHLLSLEDLLRQKNEKIKSLEDEISTLKEKIVQMAIALKTLGTNLAEEESQHSQLKLKNRELIHDYQTTSIALNTIKSEYETVRTKLKEKTEMLQSLSSTNEKQAEKVLKTETLNSDADFEIKQLKLQNKELASKLKQTKLALDKTLERLNTTSQDKEQVERAVCRQLHRAHELLRAGRKKIENQSGPNPPSVGGDFA